MDTGRSLKLIGQPSQSVISGFNRKACLNGLMMTSGHYLHARVPTPIKLCAHTYTHTTIMRSGGSFSCKSIVWFLSMYVVAVSITPRCQAVGYMYLIHVVSWLCLPSRVPVSYTSSEHHGPGPACQHMVRNTYPLTSGSIHPFPLLTRLSVASDRNHC